MTTGTSFPRLEQLRSSLPADTLLLLAATVAAIVWANVDPAYHDVWRRPLRIGVGEMALTKSLLLWINDLLMAVFFLVVGLELKRELVVGELSSPRAAAVPAAAALGGMVVPALIFVALVPGDAARGWAIPMATDIAFALGCVRAMGRRVPASLLVFLTAIAVVDDLGAILVIALVYSAGLAMPWLLGSAVVSGVLLLMNRANVRNPWFYVIVAAPLWFALLKSGIHATVAGVIAGLAVPADARSGESPVVRLEHALQPSVAFVVIPLFALANAGVTLESGVLRGLGEPLSLGIALGLVVGKFVGVFGGTWLAVRGRAARLPAGLAWIHVVAAAFLAGIGFTMALFIASLAYGESELFVRAKVAIVSASAVAATLGLSLLALASRRLKS